MTALPEPLVVLDDVTRKYVSSVETVWATRNVSLTVSPGEVVAIKGASGSGKSTLLNLIAGLDLPQTGNIVVDGLKVAELDDAERAHLRLHHVGYVFQSDNLIEEFSAAENVALPLEAQGVQRRLAADEAEESLTAVGLEGLGHRLPRELSGGQRQRVGIARALVGGRSVLLADEPTGALDSQTSKDIFDLVRGLSHARGVAVILCSHDPDCGLYADRTFVMTDGRLRESL